MSSFLLAASSLISISPSLMRDPLLFAGNIGVKVETEFTETPVREDEEDREELAGMGSPCPCVAAVVAASMVLL